MGVDHRVDVGFRGGGHEEGRERSRRLRALDGEVEQSEDLDPRGEHAGAILGAGVPVAVPEALRAGGADLPPDCGLARRHDPSRPHRSASVTIMADTTTSVRHTVAHVAAHGMSSPHGTGPVQNPDPGCGAPAGAVVELTED